MRDHTDAFGELRKRLAEAERYLAIDDLRARRPQLETEMGRPDLWDDPEVARRCRPSSPPSWTTSTPMTG